jgi:hypothetical protein
MFADSSDLNSPYRSYNIPSIQGTNTDNDIAPTAGVAVSPTQGLVTSENCTPIATYDVVLRTQPTGEVVITPLSGAPTEGFVTPSNITFTTNNWSQAQTFTVTGKDDAIVDGAINYLISMTGMSIDAAYDTGLVVDSVSVTNQDNDTAADFSGNLFISSAPIDITNSPESNQGASTLYMLGYALTAIGNQNPGPGQSPGPVIEVAVQQRINLILENYTLFPQTFSAPPALGVAVVVPDAEAVPLLVSFSFSNEGIFRYGNPSLGSIRSGFFGAVVVKPTDGSNTAWLNGPSYTQERNWVLSDIDMAWSQNTRFDVGPDDMSAYDPRYFLINGLNGHAAMNDINTSINGIVGDVFLIRILNAGQYDQSLHFHGNHFAIISQDGVNNTSLSDANLNSAKTVTTINVKRNSSAMILYTLKNAGTYPVHVHTPNMLTGNGVYLNGTATSIVVN